MYKVVFKVVYKMLKLVLIILLTQLILQKDNILDIEDDDDGINGINNFDCHGIWDDNICILLIFLIHHIFLYMDGVG